MDSSRSNHEHKDEKTSESTTRRVADRVHEGVDRAAEKGERLEQRLHEEREHLSDEARRMNAGILQLVQNNPWMAVGGSIALGFLIGALSRRH